VAYRLEQHGLEPTFFDGWAEGVRDLVPAWKEAQAPFGRSFSVDILKKWLAV